MSTDVWSTPLLYEGSVSKQTFTISIAILFALCWIAAAIRFYVRLGIQRSFSIDDGFLILGLCCLTAGIGIVFTILDVSYINESYLLGQSSLAFTPGYIDVAFYYQKMITVVLILEWLAICCVKLSFLFLFRKLIDRLHYMVMYWWVVLTFVIAVTGYGCAIYILACPYYYSLQALQCVSGAGLQKALNFANSQIVLDIVGDLMILVIPIHLIWKIKIGKKQKFWLSTSLCLTIVMIAVTIVRITGIKTSTGLLDSVRSDYWNIVSAEVGLIMTSATAFRTLYVSTTSSSSARKQASNTPSTDESWISQIVRSTKRMLTRVTSPRSWGSRNSSSQGRLVESTENSDYVVEKKVAPVVELGTIPRAHLTGLRKAVYNAGRSRHSMTASGLMNSQYMEEEEEEQRRQDAQTHAIRDGGPEEMQQRYGYAIHYPQRHDARRTGQDDYV